MEDSGGSLTTPDLKQLKQLQDYVNEIKTERDELKQELNDILRASTAEANKDEVED